MSTRLSRHLRRFGAFVLAMAGALTLAQGPAGAQNLFAPAIFVNDQAVTGYEIEQRARMLTLFRAPGDTNRLAREQLIIERVHLGSRRWCLGKASPLVCGLELRNLRDVA